MISPAAAKAAKGFDLGMSAREISSYSVAKAILAALDPKGSKSSFEAEVSQTLGEMAGRPLRAPNSIFIPTQLNPQMSGLDSKSGAAGAYTVGTRTDLFDAFRAQTRLGQLGATFLPNLRFQVAIAVESEATAAYWVVENVGEVTQKDPSYKVVYGRPKTLQSTTAVSHELLQLTADNINLEQRLRMDLMRSHAIAADAGAICGSGTEGEPVGMLNLANEISVTPAGASGAVPDYGLICDMEAAVANANAPDGIAWLTTPDVRKVLRKTFKASTWGEPVWGDAGILGRPSMVSTSVPSNLSKGSAVGTLSALICGYFPELIIAEFGVTEIVADRFALKKRNLVELTSFSMIDVLVPRIGAFNICTDVALS